MKYWLEYKKGVDSPVGRFTGGYYGRSTEEGVKPLDAKRALDSLRSNHWATGLIPAKEK